MWNKAINQTCFRLFVFEFPPPQLTTTTESGHKPEDLLLITVLPNKNILEPRTKQFNFLFGPLKREEA